MLGQGKNAMQAEIDSACEAIDFMRFNPFLRQKFMHNNLYRLKIVSTISIVL